MDEFFGKNTNFQNYSLSTSVRDKPEFNEPKI